MTPDEQPDFFKRNMGRWLRDFQGADEDVARVRRRCTPELLLALIERLGRMPTLLEIKQEFGGILGAYVSAWTLQAEGRWPATRPGKPRHRRRRR